MGKYLNKILRFIVRKFRTTKAALLFPTFKTYKGVILNITALAGLLTTMFFNLALMVSGIIRGDPFDSVALVIALVFLVLCVFFLLGINIERFHVFWAHVFALIIIAVALWFFSGGMDFATYSITCILGTFVTGILVDYRYALIYGTVTMFIYLWFAASVYDSLHLARISSVWFSITLAVVAAAFIIRRVFIANHEQSQARQQTYDKQKSLMLDIAHKLRTPLTTMYTEIDLLAKSAKAPKASKDLRKAWQEINDAATELTSLSKMNLTEIQIDSDLTNLSTLLNHVYQQALTVTQNYEKVHDVKRNIYFYEQKWLIEPVASVSQEQIMEALLNIVYNSVIHNTAKPTVNIYISLVANSNYYQIKIIDDGVGISDAKLKKLKENISDKSSANSMGLLVAKSIIDVNHGKFKISSQPNKGTQVEILLPKA